MTSNPSLLVRRSMSAADMMKEVLGLTPIDGIEPTINAGAVLPIQKPPSEISPPPEKGWVENEDVSFGSHGSYLCLKFKKIRQPHIVNFSKIVRYVLHRAGLDPTTTFSVYVQVGYTIVHKVHSNHFGKFVDKLKRNPTIGTCGLSKSNDSFRFEYPMVLRLTVSPDLLNLETCVKAAHLAKELVPQIMAIVSEFHNSPGAPVPPPQKSAGTQPSVPLETQGDMSPATTTAVNALLSLRNSI
jgi:hypothetical protein